MKFESQPTEYGPIPRDWNLRKLNSLCTKKDGIQTGPFGSQLHMRDYQDRGTPIITVEHIGGYRIRHTDLPLVSDDDKRRLNRYILQKDDIVFSRVGSVDRVSSVHEEETGWLLSGRCLRVRPDPHEINSVFLSYFFRLPAFKNHINRIAVGATMPSLNTHLLSNVEVIVPDRTEQDNIAEVLTTFDRLIDLDSGMNEVLESIARAIFKSWFIDFDPVHAKAEGRMPFGMDEETVSLFPDSFEGSELGEIPKGWHVCKIGDVISLEYGKALKKGSRIDGPIPVYGSNGQIGWHDEIITKGPGIVVGRKGNPGIVTWAPSSFYAIDTTFYVVPKEKIQSIHYLFFALKEKNLSDAAADSAVPGLNRNIAYNNELLIPPKRIVDSFDSIVCSLFKMIHACERQSQTLSSIRDALLPKLLSGEIRISVSEEMEKVDA